MSTSTATILSCGGALAAPSQAQLSVGLACRGQRVNTALTPRGLEQLGCWGAATLEAGYLPLGCSEQGPDDEGATLFRVGSWSGNSPISRISATHCPAEPARAQGCASQALSLVLQQAAAKEAHQQVLLRTQQGVRICESIPVGASRGTVPGPLALQPFPDLLVASATGRASGSARRARDALRQPSAPSTARYDRVSCRKEVYFFALQVRIASRCSKADLSVEPKGLEAPVARYWRPVRGSAGAPGITFSAPVPASANTRTLQHAMPWYIIACSSAAPCGYTGSAPSAGYPAPLHAVHNTQGLVRNEQQQAVTTATREFDD